MLCLFAAVASGLAGCAPGNDLPPLPQADQASGRYRLGPGDQLHIIIFGEDQLTGSFTVDDSGGVALPLIGIVSAPGLTPEELASKIAQRLRKQNLLADPNVTVSVTKYRPIYILGEVSKPGEYPFEPGMTLLSAVSVAGGFTYRGIQDYASVVRVIDDKVVESKVTRQTLIRPGDVITVFERHF
ncbi:MAG: polysaccharide biosynthesis/export family protein [Rhodopila sp.]